MPDKAGNQLKGTYKFRPSAFEEKYRIKELIAFKNFRNTFVSLEPLLRGPISHYVYLVDWIIIGALTGAKSQEFKPKLEWIEDVVSNAERLKIPIFMKNNLKSIWKDDLMQQFPKAF